MALGAEQDQIRDLRTGLPGPLPSAAHDLPSTLTWATFLLIGCNVCFFVVMALAARSTTFNAEQLAAWGGNSGYLDLSGQWWRLLTHQFMHLNLLHIAVNMWAVWAVGRLIERLYGSVSLLFVYLVTGVLAGLTSVVWNPDQVSVGASGSIFGMLGCLLMLLFFSRNEAPPSALRYWIPALLFVVFSLVSGVNQPAIDNAAHVGGLLAGLGIGAVVQPLEPQRRLPLTKGLLAGLFASACALPLLWYLGAFEHRTSAFAEFAAGHRWYMDRETPNLLLWQDLAMQAKNQSISEDELGRRFETDIVPFWKEADARLGHERAQPRTARNPWVPLLADFARLRHEWAETVVEAARDESPEHVQAALEYARQVNLVQARIDRLKLLTAVSDVPRALSDSTLARRLIDHIPGYRWQCIETRLAKNVSATDAPADGPAQRHAMGCLAQQMFMAGDYAGLDARLRKYASNLADLPDGTSHYEGIWNGLDDLFESGRISVSVALRHTADWQQRVGGSPTPLLVEAQIFREWAYQARGHGYASSVSPEAQAFYEARSEMAAASLGEATEAASNTPQWYVLSLDVGRDESSPNLRAIFDRGAAKYPAYLSLYRHMLVSLMPRWGGSTAQVDDFIVAASKKAGGGAIDPAMYARLYLAYGNLEGGDYNVIEAASADPVLMKAGLEKLRQRYANSDYVLNAVARFACIDNEVFAYRALRPMLNNRPSSTAWPDQLSIASCNTWSN
jgi:rhomboid protease GluP